MRDIAKISDMTGMVEEVLRDISPPSPDGLQNILDSAQRLVPPTIEEAAGLLSLADPDAIERLCEAAGRVKEAVFGPRVVLFAPLYLSNHCVNGCLYCGFRRSDDRTERRTLTLEEAVGQAEFLSSTGFKRLLVVVGEHPLHGGVDYLVEVAEAIYKRTDIRILHVNCAPLDTDDFKTLKGAGYGVYQCFQETYHRPTYARMHPFGPKKDYDYRLKAMDRALQAGFGDVGIGALLGLYDYRYEVLSAISHSRGLEDTYGAAAHTVSVPRLRHARGSALELPPSPVSDQEFRKVVAVYRLCLPYTGVVVTTREPEALRDSVLLTGASQISAGSSTEPGGYGVKPRSATQFDVSDARGLSEMVGVIAKKGLLPSLCTSCYRSGRQGDRFLHTAKGGAIKDFCTPNAVLSLMEFALDTPDKEVGSMCEEAAMCFAGTLEGPLKSDLMKKLSELRQGVRDLRY